MNSFKNTRNGLQGRWTTVQSLRVSKEMTEGPATDKNSEVKFGRTDGTDGRKFIVFSLITAKKPNIF